MRRSQRWMITLSIALLYVVVYMEPMVTFGWNIQTLTLAIVILAFLYSILRDYRAWRYSERGHPKPLKAWFTEKGFSDPYAKIKNPKIPIGKSELWYIVGPRIATEFEVINIRFVDPDRKASVTDVEFDRPIDFPRLRKREPDGKGGMDVVFTRPYRMIPPRQYLKIKLTVEGYKAGEDYINFMAPIGRGRMARVIYGEPQKVIIEA